MDLARRLAAVSFAALACTAQAQTSQYAPSRPSTPSTASTPTVDFDAAGNRRDGETGMGAGTGASTMGGTGASAATASTARLPSHAPATQMLGAGAFGRSDGLEGAVNSGTPPTWDRKAATRKVCPPGMENRNNICAAPLGSLIAP